MASRAGVDVKVWRKAKKQARRRRSSREDLGVLSPAWHSSRVHSSWGVSAAAGDGSRNGGLGRSAAFDDAHQKLRQSRLRLPQAQSPPSSHVATTSSRTPPSGSSANSTPSPSSRSQLVSSRSGTIHGGSSTHGSASSRSLSSRGASSRSAPSQRSSRGSAASSRSGAPAAKPLEPLTEADGGLE